MKYKSGTLKSGVPVAIEGSCPSCKKVYSFGDEYAGRMMLCSQCKNIYEVPTPGGIVEDKTTLPPPEIRPRDERAEPAIGWEHITAGRICFWLGVLAVIAAVIFGGLAALLSGMPAPKKQVVDHGVLIMLCGGIALTALFMGVLYIFCGSNIREGGKISAWIMLLISFVQILSWIGGLASQLTGSSMGPVMPGNVSMQQMSYGGIGVGLVSLFIYMKLFACLLKVVTRRQPRMVAC